MQSEELTAIIPLCKAEQPVLTIGGFCCTNGWYIFFSYLFAFLRLIFLKVSIFFTPLILFVLLNVIPNFTILVRRLHDSSKSGYWLLLLLLLIPLCFLVILIFTLLPSDGDNRYGADPHNIRNFNEI